MIYAAGRKELIEATGAIVVDRNTVRMVGGVELPIGEFDREAGSFFSLAADTPKHAAEAVLLHATKIRPQITVK